MKKFIPCIIISYLFSSLQFVHSQENIQNTPEIAEVSYDPLFIFPEPSTMLDNGIAFNTASTIQLQAETSINFVYVIATILCLLIIFIISFRIRKNTLKLF